MASVICVLTDEAKSVVPFLRGIAHGGHRVIVCTFSLEHAVSLLRKEGAKGVGDVLLIDGALVTSEAARSVAEQAVDVFEQCTPGGTVLEWSLTPVNLCDVWVMKEPDVSNLMDCIERFSKS